MPAVEMVKLSPRVVIVVGTAYEVGSEDNNRDSRDPRRAGQDRGARRWNCKNLTVRGNRCRSDKARHRKRPRRVYGVRLGGLNGVSDG